MNIRILNKISGIFLMILGAILYNSPEEALITITVLVGFLLLAKGIFSLILYKYQEAYRASNYLAKPLIEILLAGLILLEPDISGQGLGLVLGIWLVLSGSNDILFSRTLKLLPIKANTKSLFLSGLLSIFMGLILIGNPHLSTVFISLSMIFYGLRLYISY